MAVTLPLGAISRVEVGKQNNARKYYVEVHSKDFRILRFLFGRTEKHQRDSLHRSLVESGYLGDCLLCVVCCVLTGRGGVYRLLFPRTPERLFAFFYKPSHLIDDYSAAPQIGESGGELESRAKAEADRELGGLSERAGDCEDDEWKSEGWRIFSARAEFQRLLPPLRCFLLLVVVVVVVLRPTQHHPSTTPQAGRPQQQMAADGRQQGLRLLRKLPLPAGRTRGHLRRRTQGGVRVSQQGADAGGVLSAHQQRRHRPLQPASRWYCALHLAKGTLRWC